MSLEGKIVEFLDADQLRLAYVRKEERDRLHAVDPRGRNLSVSGERVVIVHRPAQEAEFPALARTIGEKIAALQTEVDVELLWGSLEGSSLVAEPGELAALFFSDSTPEAASAVFRALSEDTLFFRRKGSQFFAKTGEQVSVERTRRQREREREESRARTFTAIRQLLRGKEAPVLEETAALLERIQNWLRHRTGDEVGTALEEIAGAGKARDAAYDILLRAGRVDPSIDRQLVIAGVDGAFAPPVLEAASRLTAYTPAPDRQDYQDLAAFTIDDEDTNEIDDALTVVQSGTEIVVGIHIADVSAFVHKDDLLDSEAARRSSTIYLPAASVRMFPDRLSTDLASLNSGRPRPAYTVEVRFDENGNRLGYRIVRTTLRVARRLSYDEADLALETGDSALQILHRMALHLHDARAARGAITFRRPELKIRVDPDGVHIKKINPRSPSRFLVSEMMILANGISADFASVNALPVIYRTQEPREALALEDTPVIEALAFERLRKTFKRSRLSLTPGLHSGLGLTAYTQASSPIRRYADLVTQRQFTALLSGSAIPHGREELLQVMAAAETAEQEIRGIEDRSTHYWLLEYLARYQKDALLQAVCLDAKGTVELDDYYLRAKAAGVKAQPGESLAVQIESVEPLKGDIRLRAV